MSGPITVPTGPNAACAADINCDTPISDAIVGAPDNPLASEDIREGGTGADAAGAGGGDAAAANSSKFTGGASNGVNAADNDIASP
ncbi:hypothetical protein MmonteBS_19910 [Mycobacterium montefiorense]|uniref:PE-PGRS family protein n=1 Tax=Mycobacterium montefiorense TaxID=154654 RepID=A0ABQ0NL55_9MYCO|nr:hypothetical protein MmonteBS_19910 [Mycobacterium montefiorense]GKU40076.1 hypothetical protein NJB14192_20640 [Mycobacterium montefiorense]GKU50439.1 hypothetical protein NJB14195_16850 [Mycobacterium montefiorense]